MDVVLSPAICSVVNATRFVVLRLKVWLAVSAPICVGLSRPTTVVDNCETRAVGRAAICEALRSLIFVMPKLEEKGHLRLRPSP